jgi:hypothetical protein
MAKKNDLLPGTLDMLILKTLAALVGHGRRGRGSELAGRPWQAAS